MLVMIDNYDSFTYNIVQYFAELGADVRVFRNDEITVQEIEALNPDHLVISPGPCTPNEAGISMAAIRYFAGKLPILGICLGHQSIGQVFGGNIIRAGQVMHGKISAIHHANTGVFAGLKNPYNATRYHSLVIDKQQLPDCLEITAWTENPDGSMEEIMGVRHRELPIEGVQFHPEVTHTVQGQAILDRFVLGICRCRGDWTMPGYVDETIAKVREQVGTDAVILGLSGGVDSSVAAALIHRAIGDQLTCVFVDHGLLRLNEAEQVMSTFGEHMGVKVIHVDATHDFMSKLDGVTDPEAKRKIIGKEFVEVFQREAGKIENAKWLAQGTIYPDVIESAGAKTGKAMAIKSHHNVGGLPETLNLKLLEPLRELFKDEVRKLGIALGLPPEMVYRHPFPGPGLGVRILGAVNKPFADWLRQADAIFIEELRNTVDAESGKTWYDLTSQAFAVFLPVKSVGVMGDGRTYEYVVALRAVQTSDFMTADWAPLPYPLLAKVSSRIINEVKGINRVVYDVSSKPPATIEWE